MNLTNKIRIVTQNFHQKKFKSVIKECKKILKVETNNPFIYNLCGLDCKSACPDRKCNRRVQLPISHRRKVQVSIACI